MSGVCREPLWVPGVDIGITNMSGLDKAHINGLDHIVCTTKNEVKGDTFAALRLNNTSRRDVEFE